MLVLYALRLGVTIATLATLASGCAPTVNGPWLSLNTIVQACPSPGPTPPAFMR